MIGSVSDGLGTGLVAGVLGVDPAVYWAEPLIGEWWIEPSLCYYDRLHPVPPDPEGWTPLNRGGRRPTSGAGGIGVGKWTYVPEGAGVRTFYFFGNGPDSPAAHMMQYFATWDGTPWADPHSTLLPGQLAQVWRLDPYLVVRLVLDNKAAGCPRWEWAAWASATDARSFACTSWDATDPDRHNLQVFRKHLGAVYDSRGTAAPVATPGADGGEKRADAAGFVGAWSLDVASSSFLLGGQDAPHAGPGDCSRRLSMEATAGGLRERSPGSVPDASMRDWAMDGVERSGGEGATLSSWTIGGELLVRRRRLGAMTSWSLAALSSDARTLAITSWDQRAPAHRDIEVFRREGEPA